MIADKGSYFENDSNTFEDLFKNTLPQDSCGMLLQTLRSVVGVLTSFDLF